MSNNKMKGLLKGLRYISQIFDNEEKEVEMEIGYPTDVKHVAHIGCDGPSTVDSPSWMNEFKSPHESSSAPLSANREINEDLSVKWISEDQGRRSTASGTSNSSARMPSSPRRVSTKSAKDLPELPKSSRRHSTGNSSGSDSPTKAKSDKPKQTRRSSKGATKDLNVDGASKPTRDHKDPSQGSDSASNLPDIPKKTRRKKSKDSSQIGGSTSKSSRGRAKALEVDGESESGSVSNRERSHSAEENELIGVS